MSDLVAVLFDDESTAFEMRAALVKMQRDYLIELKDVVVGHVLRTSLTKDTEELLRESLESAA